jgi:hypothetical protein
MDRLLTKDAMSFINAGMPSEAKYGEVFAEIAKAQDSKTAKIVRADDLDEFLKKLNELVVLRSEIKSNGDVMIKGGAIYELIKEYTLEKAKLKAGEMPK